LQVLFPVGANNRIQGTEIDANPGAGLTDSAIVAVSLGWPFKGADASAGYSIFLPTGRYTDGAKDNTGFGMWGHELSFGTTVYLNRTHEYHSATVVSFDFQSKKEDSETKVGNAMNLEGGVGRDFLKGLLTAGLNYYGSFKLTDDHIEGFPDILIRGKNKVFALGPEVSVPVMRKGDLRIRQSELPVGDIREDRCAGRRADDHRDVSRETAQALDSVTYGVVAR
jgi:hypothetical protein